MSILAALATVPGREHALAQCLTSLRMQVDRIHVVCHDMDAPPRCVVEMADQYVCEYDARGSAAKLEWASEHVGLYLACDDDFCYPPDYVETMQRWVRRWKGQALVTCHGRILKPHAKEFGDVTNFWSPQGATDGVWLNYPGCCALAFDTRLGVPMKVPGKNLEESYLALWAQYRRVPIWLVAHSAGWLKYLLHDQKIPTIWEAEKKARFANRNAVLSQNPRWRVYHA